MLFLFLTIHFSGFSCLGQLWEKFFNKFKDISIFLSFVSSLNSTITLILFPHNLLDTFEIPSNLLQFNPIVNNEKLHLTYDKSKISINNIIKILNESDIAFSEMNTYESNLEDVFKKLIVNNGNN